MGAELTDDKLGKIYRQWNSIEILADNAGETQAASLAASMKRTISHEIEIREGKAE